MASGKLQASSRTGETAVTQHFKTLDGNEAVAAVAYRLNEVIAIYPITPASSMGEWADLWASRRKTNLWGVTPKIIEMQSEAGAAGALHGALLGGSLGTTFTSSQGLLLMIPNLYKIAGELTPCVIHVAARTVAAHALSIFGDHSDVMGVRGTGFAMLCSSSVQEAQDFALISQAATLESRIPFLHFFDGFRTSHEVSKIVVLEESQLRAMIDDALILAHRSRSLNPDKPVIRGTAQNPDVFFQSREAVNPFYDACPGFVQGAMDRFAQLTGRSYKIFEYSGAPDAERVVIAMGSALETVEETVLKLMEKGEKVGLLKVRLYRPFVTQAFLDALPKSVRSIAVLDRTREPGALGEPLYLDCAAAVYEGARQGHFASGKLPVITGGRYGLASKEFTPGMVRAVFDHLKQDRPAPRFTVGIHDDVSGLSLDYDRGFSVEPPETTRAVFYGLGSDGTVGANKNSIKIIGEHTPLYAQGYFVYDSKKSGAVTVSHLRFGPKPIRAPYLVDRANFIACHQPFLVERFDMLADLEPGGTFLLNTPVESDKIFDKLPLEYQEKLIQKKLKFFVIDAAKVVQECGLGSRINTAMQACFFVLSNVLPRDKALEAIKQSVRDTYGLKSEGIVEKNIAAIDKALENFKAVTIPAQVGTARRMPVPVSELAPDFIKSVLAPIIAGRGDDLPVSAMPVDGTFPVGTSQWEKRNLSGQVPVWDTSICIQCNKCVLVCPHAVIRAKVCEPAAFAAAPSGFLSADAKDRDWKGLKYTLQVSAKDCTGCSLCVEICPVKNKTEAGLKALNMRDRALPEKEEDAQWDYFLGLPELDRSRINVSVIRQQQIQQPLFEFSGACAGCGETPYLKLLSQLFGDRTVIANATGCSSIFGANLPTTPWTKNSDGRGPAWANSLFEDNAEFGLGIRLSLDQQKDMAEKWVRSLKDGIGAELADSILGAAQKSEADIYDQRGRVDRLKKILEKMDHPDAKSLLDLSGSLVRKNVWIVGGDGWAYDIGFSGLDHALASGQNVKILVLDTQVYSNTGGQMSKATPQAAVAKFAAGGKPSARKDLGLITMSYGHVYVAQVAMGAKDEHTLRAFLEAENFDGPSLIIAYSHCIAHGINMTTGMGNQKAAVDSGQWLLYRYHPGKVERGENPLTLDSAPPTLSLDKYFQMENRFNSLGKSQPAVAKDLLDRAQKESLERWEFYKQLAAPRAKEEKKNP